LGRAPNTATAEDLRRFQIDQREAGVPVPTMNSIVSALRFFFTHTLDRPDLARRLVRVTHPRKVPVVLSTDEVGRLLNATTCLKHQAALSVAYGAGLRVAEVSCLKVSDIDSERMLFRIERGKGGQYRNAMLSTDMLALLRQWWKVGRQQGVMHPKGWLFPGQHAGKPISTRQLHRIVVGTRTEITACLQAALSADTLAAGNCAVWGWVDDIHQCAGRTGDSPMMIATALLAGSLRIKACRFATSAAPSPTGQQKVRAYRCS
jgi:site-specific recombinase XerD